MRLRTIGVAPAALLLLAAAALLTACSPKKEQGLEIGGSKPPKMLGSAPAPNVGPFPRTVVDSRGKSLTFAAPPKRVVSLAPSNTELLYALGAQDSLVAVTTACDYPPEALKKPKVGDFQVSAERVQSFNPDLVVTVGSINGKTADALERAGMKVFSVDPKTIAGTYTAIRLLGTVTGRDAEAARIIMEQRARVDAVKRAVASATAKPKVFSCYGVKPTIYTTGPGSFIDDLITVAGGDNIVKTPMPEGSVISAEKVVQAQPDVIICGFEVKQDVVRMPGWNVTVPAVKNNRFFDLTNSNPLVRPGPRLADAAEQLAEFLHPEVYDRSKHP